MDKLTIIKVLSQGTPVSQNDLERWRQVFAQKLMTLEEAEATGEVTVEYVEPIKAKHTLTLIKVGGDGYQPTPEELEIWRDIFEDAVGDPDFKIFTHPYVEIDVIDLGEIITVE